MGKQVGQAVRRPHECSNYFGIGYRELERTVNRPVELLDDLVVLIDLGYVLLKAFFAFLSQVNNTSTGGHPTFLTGLGFLLLYQVLVSSQYFKIVHLLL